MGFSAPKVTTPPAAPQPPSVSSQIAFATKPRVGPASAAGTLGGTFMTGAGGAQTTGSSNKGKKSLLGQ